MADDDSPVDAREQAHRQSLDMSGSDARGLGHVRRWIRRILAAAGRDHVQDVVMVTDELASNAYEHGGGLLVVRVSHPPGLRLTTVEVDNRLSLGVPTVGRSRLGAETHRGRGLVMVDKLARAWGFRRVPGARTGTTVWAEIDCPEYAALTWVARRRGAENGVQESERGEA